MGKKPGLMINLIMIVTNCVVLRIALFGFLSSNVGNCDFYVVFADGISIAVFILFERCTRWLPNFLGGYEATSIRSYPLCASRQLFNIYLGALGAVPH